MDDKKRKRIVRQNFLRSLKELETSVGKAVKEDLVKGVAKTSARQVLGQPSAGGEYKNREAIQNQYAGSEQQPLPEQKEKFRWSRQEFTDIKSQEKLLIQRAKKEVRLKVEAIRSELVKLVGETRKLTKQTKIATEQAPTDPGVYHVTFLERLRNFIVFMRKNIAESRHWLAMQNQRSKKRNYYWGQVKKSGTKFMLSSERYMATQAG